MKNSIIGFGHLSVTVKNLEESLHFYHDILGFEVLMEREKEVPNLGILHVVSLGSPTGNMELIRLPDGMNRQEGFGGNWHFSFVTEDIEKTMAVLEKEGYKFSRERLDRDPNWIGGRPVKSIHFAGPNGEHMELEEFE